MSLCCLFIDGTNVRRWNNALRLFVVIFITLYVGGCLGIPKGVSPVDKFDVNKYLGTWYEIARLDHSFERGLDRVTAEYSLRGDGGLRVINRGYSIADDKWKEAEGKAYFVKDRNQGYLRVSFFGPFYGSYVVFGLDKEHYQYAFITGPDTSYLWLLSRTPKVSQELVDSFIERSRVLGFHADGLIYVRHH
jgi:apolipoprotein D and lipocalin family protein